MPKQEMRGGRDDRSMQRQDVRNNRGNRPEYAAPRHEAPRPSTYHPDNKGRDSGRPDNNRGRDNGHQRDRQDHPDRGRDEKH
jgi:hypothetical protein